MLLEEIEKARSMTYKEHVKAMGEAYSERNDALRVFAEAEKRKYESEEAVKRVKKRFDYFLEEAVNEYCLTKFPIEEVYGIKPGPVTSRRRFVDD